MLWAGTWHIPLVLLTATPMLIVWLEERQNRVLSNTGCMARALSSRSKVVPCWVEGEENTAQEMQVTIKLKMAEF